MVAVTADGATTRELERMMEEFPDLPVEAVIKQDILRQGLAFSPDALRVASGYKPKDYFIFTFDLVPVAEMVLAYDGKVELSRSELGGAKVDVALAV